MRREKCWRQNTRVVFLGIWSALLYGAQILFTPIAHAGEIVQFGCEDGQNQQTFYTGAGRVLAAQGLVFDVFYCENPQKVQGFLIEDPQFSESQTSGSFSRMQAFATLEEPDTRLLSDYFSKAGPAGDIYRPLFGDLRELTFADVRGTVASVARYLAISDQTMRYTHPFCETQTLRTERECHTLLPRYRLYSHPSCDTPLIPMKYYTQEKISFPLCPGEQKIYHIRRPFPDPVWD